MLKALVFDDEYIVLRGLEKLIDWPEYGIELAGTAADGLSALRLFREMKPDIILTDIRMPGMDGLTLIETIRAEAPDTMCIVFSGYNEFEYVRSAIKLGVVDYLEKPVNIEKIREGISKAVARIEELNDYSSLKRKWQQGLLEKSVLQLLEGGPSAAEEWAESFGPDAAKVEGVTVLVSKNEAPVVPDSEEYRLVRVSRGGESIGVVFHFRPSSEEWTSPLAAWTQELIGSGRTYSSVAEAPKSYKEAQRALRYGKFLEGKGWVRFEDLGESHAESPLLPEWEEAMLFDLRIGDKDGLMEKLDRYLEEFRGAKLTPEAAEVELLKILTHGLDVAKETGGNPSDIYPAGYWPQLEIRNLHTPGEMADWLRKEMETIMDWILGVRHRSKHAAIEKALRYIGKNYGRDLTQQEVADHVQMNATYFSLLFKEEMDISYIKYLTQVRMEKAKLLLGAGESIQEISEKVGYQHARHFSEVFKKYAGVTPGQFRQQGRPS
ncbi:response regulator [Cohnella sp. AR92]|uniref:response regulator n=1 Tax=Cohnella sp. AR92 TaxID=648716 RepID=UPI000F8C36CE|nr:response regulator [Cohnella sp. AR92]RUS43960.1 response regulator transcription factor [Cohnella sp. AR92]